MASISVVVPVYNREELVVRCLASIFNQTLKPNEIIVVDNNSTDLTLPRVKSWMNSHKESGINFKLLREESPGACPARQKGLENAVGDYVIFFDSDDEMHPDLIEKASKKIEMSPSADVICWRALIRLLDGRQHLPPFIISGDLLESHLIHALLRPQGYIVKKDFLEKIGGWMKPLKVWNDFELGFRILLQNPKVVTIPEVLADIYSQKESITGKDFSSKEGLWEVTLAEMDRENVFHDHPQKRRIKKILNYRRIILAAHYYREGNIEGAEKLKNDTLKNEKGLYRFLLKFAYQFTRRGYRGAWRLIRQAYILSITL